MEPKEIISEAFSTLFLNKMRTGLAVLGIVIGIGSVIALISLGQSGQKSVENQIQSLGANMLTVIPSVQGQGPVRTAAGSVSSLTREDARAIVNSSEVTTVSNVSAELSRRAQVTAGRNNTNTQVVGADTSIFTVRKMAMASGVFLSDRDISSQTKVAVLGPQVASDLFGDSVDPVGETIRINKQLLRVIGVTASKGGSGFSNPDDAIYVPITTAQKQIFGDAFVTAIAVEATSQDVMTQAQNEIGYLILKRHKLTDPAAADFMILSQNDILNTVSQVTGTFTMLLGGIAAISLLVGGIGIMNIMLVTVTERTREIGLRKALGAKKKHIITQFLAEAIILTSIGGITGMLFGIGVSFILTSVMSLPFAVSLSSIILAIGVSAAVGVVFGWYPAKKAADLQPIEALRYE